MQDGNGSRLRHRRTAISVIGLAAAALVLASCSSTPSTTGSLATDTFGAQPSSGQSDGGGGGNVAVAAASVSITPGASAKINPATTENEIVVTVANSRPSRCRNAPERSL